MKYLIKIVILNFIVGAFFMGCSSSNDSEGGLSNDYSNSGILIPERIDIIPAKTSSNARKNRSNFSVNAPSGSDYNEDTASVFTKQRIGEAMEIANSLICEMGDDQIRAQSMINEGVYGAEVNEKYCRRVNGNDDSDITAVSYDNKTANVEYDGSKLKVTLWVDNNNESGGGSLVFEKNTEGNKYGVFNANFKIDIREYGTQSFRVYGYIRSYSDGSGLNYFDFSQPLKIYQGVDFQNYVQDGIQAVRLVYKDNFGYGRILGSNSNDNSSFAYNEDYYMVSTGGAAEECYSRNDVYQYAIAYGLYDSSFKRVAMVDDDGTRFSPMIVSYTHSGNVSNSGTDYSGWSGNLTYFDFGHLVGVPFYDNDSNPNNEYPKIENKKIEDITIPAGEQVTKVSGGDPSVAAGTSFYVKPIRMEQILKSKNLSDCNGSGLSLANANSLSLPDESLYSDPQIGEPPQAELKVKVGKIVK